MKRMTVLRILREQGPTLIYNAWTRVSLAFVAFIVVLGVPALFSPVIDSNGLVYASCSAGTYSTMNACTTACGSMGTCGGACSVQGSVPQGQPAAGAPCNSSEATCGMCGGSWSYQCSCPAPESGSTQCFDGIDNDDDGTLDCDDSGCASQGGCQSCNSSCTTLGSGCNWNGTSYDGTCQIGGGSCSVQGNDPNTGAPCNATSQTCSMCGGTWTTTNVCSCSGFSPENTSIVCFDGIDNDLDGNVDCQDSECGNQSGCLSCGSSCTTLGSGCNWNGTSYDGTCQIGGGSCSVQGNDPNTGAPCNATSQTCSMCGGNWTTTNICACGPATETVCNDGIDNDNSGGTDCDDSDCAGNILCTPTCVSLTANPGTGLANATNVGVPRGFTCALGPSYNPAYYDYEVSIWEFLSNTANITVVADATQVTWTPTQATPYSASAFCRYKPKNSSSWSTFQSGGNTLCSISPIVIVNTGAAEVCDDYLDNNANGQIDCADTACAGTPICQQFCDIDRDGSYTATPNCNNTFAWCNVPDGICGSAGNCCLEDAPSGAVDCLENNAAVHPGATGENTFTGGTVCSDSVDNDCDGGIDYFVNGTGDIQCGLGGSCNAGIQATTTGRSTSCGAGVGNMSATLNTSGGSFTATHCNLLNASGDLTAGSNPIGGSVCNFTNLQAGTYYIQIEYGGPNSCQTTVTTQPLTVGSEPCGGGSCNASIVSPVTTGRSSSCGAGTGYIVANLSDPTGIYQIPPSGCELLNSSGTPINSYNPVPGGDSCAIYNLAPGSYYVRINYNGPSCQSTTTTPLQVLGSEPCPSCVILPITSQGTGNHSFSLEGLPSNIFSNTPYTWNYSYSILSGSSVVYSSAGNLTPPQVPNPYQFTAPFSGIGNFSIQYTLIEDDSLVPNTTCSSSYTVINNAPVCDGSLSITGSRDTSQCGGAGGGTITATASNAQNITKYELLNNQGVIVQTQVTSSASVTFSNVTAGTYTVKLYYGNGCTHLSTNITITSNGCSTEPLCNTLSITPNPGVAGSAYSFICDWTGFNPNIYDFRVLVTGANAFSTQGSQLANTSPVWLGLPNATPYTASCQYKLKASSVYLSQQACIQTITPQPPLNCSDFSFTVTPSATTINQTVTAAWTNPSTSYYVNAVQFENNVFETVLPSASTKTHQFSTPGSYTVKYTITNTITNVSNICDYGTNITITNPSCSASPTITSVSSTPNICPVPGQNDGTVTINATAVGQMEYGIDLDHDGSIDANSRQLSNSFSGLPAGTYTIGAKIAGSSCSITITTVSVGLIGLPTVSATSTTTTCGSNNGSVTVTAQGPGGAVEYAIKPSAATNFGPWQLTPTFSNLAPGIYVVGVRYQNSAYQSQCAIVEYIIQVGGGCSNDCQQNQQSVALIKTNESSCQANNGSIQVQFNGNGTPTQYLLKQGSTILATSSTPNFQNLEPGTYTVEVMYTNNGNSSCSIVSASTTITAAFCQGCNTNATATAVAYPATCGNADGYIVVSIQNAGSITNVLYDLYQGQNFLQSYQTSFLDNIAAGTNYHVKVFYDTQTASCSLSTNAVTIATSPACSGTPAVCGAAQGGSFTGASAVNSAGLCSVGTASPTQVGGAGPWNWSCISPNGGANASCFAYNTIVTPPVHGLCGPANAGNYTSAAQINSAGLCSSGTPVPLQVSGTGVVSRQCLGQYGGNTAQCSANVQPVIVPTTGQCGIANGVSFGNASQIAPYMLCSIGTATPSQPSGNGPWSWQCLGTNGGASASCIAYQSSNPTPINGQCGAASGGNFSSAQNATLAGLCSAGTANPTQLTGSGPRTWQCQGINGGSTITCSAGCSVPHIPINGQCGPAHGKNFSNASLVTAAGLCTNGLPNPLQLTGDGARSWQCLGAYSGTTASCNAGKSGGSGGGGGGGGGGGYRPPVTPSKNLVNTIKMTLLEYKQACRYDDVDYHTRLQQMKDISREDRYDPAAILTTYCITKGYKDKRQLKALTSIGEAIKMVAKTVAIPEKIQFKEGEKITKLYYSDMKPNAWYATYVDYAEKKGLLDGLTDSHRNKKELKALTPISMNQFDTLLQQAKSEDDMHSVAATMQTNGDEVDAFLATLQRHQSTSVDRSGLANRANVASVVVKTFPERFAHYRYLVGNNIRFYETLVRKLEPMSPASQLQYIKNLITHLRKQDAKKIGKELRIDIEVIIELLEKTIQ